MGQKSSAAKIKQFATETFLFTREQEVPGPCPNSMGAGDTFWPKRLGLEGPNFVWLSVEYPQTILGGTHYPTRYPQN